MDKKSVAEAYLFHKNLTAPKEALRPLQYAGALQKERLEKFGLNHNSSVRFRGQIKGQKVSAWQDEYYEEEMFAHSIELTDSFCREEKKIFQRAKNLLFYSTVVDLRGSEGGREEDVYCCPNCGSPEKIKTLLEKCPYCDTHFEISELYPKVESTFSVADHGGTRQELDAEVKKYTIPGMVIALMIPFIGGLFSGFSFEIVFSMLICAGLGALFGYILWSVRKLGKLFGAAGKAIPLLAGAGSAKKFEKALSAYSGAYTYAHFTGTVVSLLKILVYSDADTQLPFYAGKANNLFEDVIDCSYRGSMELKSIEVQNSVCTAKVKVFMENLCFDGKKIKEKMDTVFLTLQKDLRGEMIQPFSIHAIQCRGCCGSFDALKNRKCPYCGSAYELQDLDWVITDMSHSF